jgi:hypothetical protein
MAEACEERSGAVIMIPVRDYIRLVQYIEAYLPNLSYILFVYKQSILPEYEVWDLRAASVDLLGRFALSN